MQPHNKYNYHTSPIVITTNKRIILKVTIVIVGGPPTFQEVEAFQSVRNQAYLKS